MKIIDLSHKLNNNSPAYPGDEKVELKKISNFDKEGFNMFELKSNMHVSTHVEVLIHMSNDKKFISDYSLEDFIGKAKVLNFKEKKEIIWKDEFDLLIEENDCILIYTGFDKHYNNDIYYNDHPVLTRDFTEKLIGKKIKLIGIDFSSPDNYPYGIHKKLLNNKINIVENLNNVDKLLLYNNIMFYAVPIKIDAESSLTRAFAICFE